MDVSKLGTRYGIETFYFDDQNHTLVITSPEGQGQLTVNLTRDHVLARSTYVFHVLPADQPAEYLVQQPHDSGDRYEFYVKESRLGDIDDWIGYEKPYPYKNIVRQGDAFRILQPDHVERGVQPHVTFTRIQVGTAVHLSVSDEQTYSIHKSGLIQITGPAKLIQALREDTL